MSHSINGHFTPASLLKFAAPSIIMMMFMSLYTIIDGIFISRFVGSNALSSLNIVYPIINIVFAIGTMLGTGGNAIISRYMGEGKNKTAKECMTQFVVIGLIISVIILVLTRLNLSSVGELSFEGLELISAKEAVVCAVKLTRAARGAAAAAGK